MGKNSNLTLSSKLSVLFSQGRFSQQGKLLLQGSFSISYENKKDKTVKDQLSRFKAQQRHVFVYENSVMFCKKREEKSDNSRQGTPRADYLYKSSLEVRLNRQCQRCVCVCVWLCICVGAWVCVCGWIEVFVYVLQ